MSTIDISELKIKNDEDLIEIDSDKEMEKSSSQKQAKQTTSSAASSSNGSPQSKPTASRRKSVHHRLILDDSISFETELTPSNDDADDSQPAKKIKQVAPASAAVVVPEQSDATSGNEDEEMVTNPNDNLIRKVAFLRACVNFMMLSLNKVPFTFETPMSLSMLIEEYNTKNKRSLGRT